MNTRTINPVQLHLLELFNYCGSEQTVSEMKDVLADFYARKVQAEADRLWDEGTLDGEAIERILHEHWRTPFPANYVSNYTRVCRNTEMN